MKKSLIFFLFLSLFLFSACTYPWDRKAEEGTDLEPVACTMDAKACPDGSYVGRQAPDCEFAPCPGELDQVDDSNVACTMDAKACPDGSYVGRQAPDCEFAPCPGEGQSASGSAGGGMPGNVGLANPASTYCVEQGGESVIVDNVDGSQYGNCVLPSGKTCEEWAYFRGECK